MTTRVADRCRRAFWNQRNRGAVPNSDPGSGNQRNRFQVGSEIPHTFSLEKVGFWEPEPGREPNRVPSEVVPDGNRNRSVRPSQYDFCPGTNG